MSERKRQVGLTDAQDCFALSESQRSGNLEAQWTKNYKTLRGDLGENWPLTIKNSHNFVLANRETLISQIKADIYAKPELLYFEPNGEVDIEEARIITAQLDRDFKTVDPPFEMEVEEAVTELVDQGTTFFKTIWVEDPETQRFRAEREGEEPREEEVIVFRGPRNFRFPLEDAYPDPNCGWNLQAADWFCHRQFVSWGYLQELAETLGFDEDAMKKIGEAHAVRTGYAQTSELDAERRWGRCLTGKDKIYAPIPLVEGWFKVGTGQFELLYFIQGDEIELKHFMKNPHWHNRFPFHCWRMVPFTDEIYGYGAITPAEGMQHTIDYQSNLITERGIMDIQPPMTVRTDYKGDREALRLGPGMLLRMDDDDQVKAFDMGRRDQSIFSDRAMNVQDLEMMMNSPAQERGQQTGERTLGQTLFRQQQVATRRGRLVTNIGNSIVGMGKRMLQLHYQYTTSNRVKIRGADNQEKWADFIGARMRRPIELFDATAGCVRASLQAARRQELADLYAATKEDLFPAQKQVAVRVLYEEVGFPKIDEIFAAGQPPPPPAGGADLPGAAPLTEGALAGQPPMPQPEELAAMEQGGALE